MRQILSAEGLDRTVPHAHQSTKRKFSLIKSGWGVKLGVYFPKAARPGNFSMAGRIPIPIVVKAHCRREAMCGPRPGLFLALVDLRAAGGGRRGFQEGPRSPGVGTGFPTNRRKNRLIAVNAVGQGPSVGERRVSWGIWCDRRAEKTNRMGR